MSSACTTAQQICLSNKETHECKGWNLSADSIQFVVQIEIKPLRN